MTAGYAGGPGFVAEDDVIAAVAAAYGDGLREGAAAERDRLQAEMDIVRAAGAAAERNAREGRKAGAAAERDRILALHKPVDRGRVMRCCEGCESVNGEFHEDCCHEWPCPTVELLAGDQP